MASGGGITFASIRPSVNPTPSGCSNVLSVANDFSERAHTVLSGSRLPKVKIASILHHLAEGYGQRQVCRLVGVSRDVVGRLTRIAGNHAQVLHNELVTSVAVNEAQADEKWCFVEKKTRIVLMMINAIVAHNGTMWFSMSKVDPSSR